MRIDAKNTLAIVVDMQERLLPVIYESEIIIQNCVTLLQGLAILDIPVMVSRQYPKGLLDTVTPIRELTKNAPILDKIEFSCYQNEGMKAFITDSKKKNILLFGVETHVCVLQTLIDLQMNHFQGVLVTDCISSRKIKDRDIGFIRARQAGALLTTTEAILFELLVAAGTDKFKQISALIK